jgi:hypothetical protein
VIFSEPISRIFSLVKYLKPVIIVNNNPTTIIAIPAFFMMISELIVLVKTVNKGLPLYSLNCYITLEITYIILTLGQVDYILSIYQLNSFSIFLYRIMVAMIFFILMNAVSLLTT